ncbi:MAG: septal ring lytic transglycosylase RlpA family protein [Rhodocyclales bacterium]|nr:septal ring lytic transglycosylase RlpA family protein [Rhodocyclales bacterium]
MVVKGLGWIRYGVAMLMAAALVGCGSSPPRGDGSRPQDGSSGAGVAPQGGGYYKDDGPHAEVPANLDDIPDATPREEPLHRAALRPYTALGQRFVPMATVQPYRERGRASWYGRRFHGKPTSIGEPYNMYAMSAAHPTLPLPSYARVTNLANGRSVVVRVNDRGPFLRSRIMDLSYAAAHRLGYINAGSAEVEVEAIMPEDFEGPRMADTTAVPAPSLAIAPAPAIQSAPAGATLPGVLPARGESGASGAYLQLGAYATPAGAEGLVERVRNEMGLFADRLHLLDDGGRYRLQLGPFTSADEARREAVRIGALLNLQPFVVIR